MLSSHDLVMGRVIRACYLLCWSVYSDKPGSRWQWPTYPIFGIYLPFLCRNFVAIAENFDNTWVNYYTVFVRQYATDSSASSLTAEEASRIPGPHRWLVGTYYILVTIGTVG